MRSCFQLVYMWLPGALTSAAEALHQHKANPGQGAAVVVVVSELVLTSQNLYLHNCGAPPVGTGGNSLSFWPPRRSPCVCFVWGQIGFEIDDTN